MNERRIRAVVLLTVGWLLPAAVSAGLVLHEIDHAHGPGAPAAVEAVLHGHLHAEDEPAHRHAFVVSADAVRLGTRISPVTMQAVGSVIAAAPVARAGAASARRDDPDPGGPSRQASLRVFRI